MHIELHRPRAIFAVGVGLVLPGTIVFGLLVAGWEPMLAVFNDPVAASAIAIVCSIAAFTGVMVLALAVVMRIRASDGPFGPRALDEP